VLLSERGILGGVYFGIIFFALTSSALAFDVTKYGFPWILLMTTLIGIIISYISYEICLPLFKWISKGLVLRGANYNIGKNHFKEYKDVRNFRETFLNENSNPHIKERIRGYLKIRITLTYLAATNITAFSFLCIFKSYFETNEILTFLIFLTIIFVFISSLIGILTRSWSLGLYIGLAKLKY
jgi:hypothetical protein